MHILREAGPPVWGVILLGALSLYHAIRWARADGRLATLVGSAAATLCAGALGTLWGLQMAFGGLKELPDPATQHWIAFVGIKEAAYNLDIALGFVLLAALVASYGRRRTDAVASVV